MLEKTIGIAIGIAIDIENNYITDMFDPDPDSDFDPENTFEKHQSLKFMALCPAMAGLCARPLAYSSTLFRYVSKGGSGSLGPFSPCF